MSKTLEFFFDFGSPASYLAWTQVPRIAREAGAQLIWRPMLLGGVFKATGNQSPVMIPSKGAWMLRDLARFASRYGVPMAFNPHFPINTLTLMRGAVGMLMRQPADFPRYASTVWQAMWVQPRNLGDAAELAAVLQAAGYTVHIAAKAGGTPGASDGHLKGAAGGGQRPGVAILSPMPATILDSLQRRMKGYRVWRGKAQINPALWANGP